METNKPVDAVVAEKPVAAAAVVPPATVTATSAAPVAEKPAAAAAEAPKTETAPAKSPWMAKPSDKAASEPTKTDASAEPAKAPEAEKFALKVPEGLSMEAAELEKYGAEKKALGLSQDQAQKLLENDLAGRKAQHEQLMQQVTKQDAEWQKSHQEKHGEKYGQVGEMLKRVFDYGDPDGSFRSSLEGMKMAHNPQLLAFAEKFIPLFQEPTLKQPSRAATSEVDTRSPMERLEARYAERFKTTAPQK